MKFIFNFLLWIFEMLFKFFFPIFTWIVFFLYILPGFVSFLGFLHDSIVKY